ncbi:hypothetical protein TVAG_224590 [Trichomonas vaginalis G3]|uniref:Uncharacterized protein n=1 Tax=Trichomonas vaginalis (strain ATCC PRA-98 / G3) TaxID=412133 RepID=A2DW82_TRIV3|nr:hypothetical protein TVAGG3_0804300 [Trichomonas vaginalis G3]EAY15383.1 hypothetical protein TVAG_224590 [Trichomonas vaginalis G3]KAI5496742.1 hypothetical protein TVAGG3_0804300 [Trichomonas vaginalis G3]|eukprot:XP_001327606.1 hypothetical protein [Trichomonas vaginalis G3]
MLEQFMRQFYEMGFETRYRAQLPFWLKWLREIIRFMQYVVLSIYFCKLSNMVGRQSSLISVLDNALLLNSWMYYQVQGYHFAMVLIVNQIIIFSIFTKISRNIKNGKHVSKNILFLYMLMYDFFTPLYQIDIFFRFNQQLHVTILNFTFNNFVTLLIHTSGLFFTSFLEFFVCTFWKPKVFVVFSILDKHSCATYYYFYWVKCLMISVHILLVEYNHFLLEIFIFSIYPLIVFVAVFHRMIRGVHASYIGAIMEDSPIFASPFVLFCHLHFGGIVNPLLVAFVCIFFYTIVIVYYKKYLQKYSYAILSETKNVSVFFPVSKSLLIRNAAEFFAYTEGFDKFMFMRINGDPEETIEVVRYLSLFKYNHTRILQILSKYTSNGAYYDFQFYLYRTHVEYQNIDAPKVYTDILDNIQRRFLVSNFLYWQCRCSNQWIKAHYYATVSSINHIELRNYINFLVFIFRYDSHIYQSFAEFSLVALGDPVRSVKYRRYAATLKENPSGIVDNLIKILSQNYPLSTQKYNHGNNERQSDITPESSQASIEAPPVPQMLRFHFDDNVIFRNDKSDNSPMAMFVQKCNSFTSYRSVFYIICIFIICSMYFKYIDVESTKRNNMISEIRLVLKNTIEQATVLSSSLLYQYLYHLMADQKNLNFSKDCCDTIISHFYDELQIFPLTIGEDYSFLMKSLGYLSVRLSEESKINCQSLSNSLSFITTNVYDMKLNYDDLKNRVSLLFTQQKKITDIKKFEKMTQIGILLGTLIVTVMTHFYLRINLIETPPSALQFLASKERLCLLLFQKSLESWDLFKILFHSKSKMKAKSKKRRTIKREDADIIDTRLLQSQHVNLSDSKLTVSFIGSDHYLQPSNFALMSPYVELNKSTLSDSILAVPNEEEDESSTTDDFIPDNEQKFEVITKTIEKTKSDFPNYWRVFGIIHVLPWITISFVVSSSTEVIEYQHLLATNYINKIIENVTSFYSIQVFNENYSFQGLTDRQYHYILQNLSHHCRMLMPDVQLMETVNFYNNNGYLSLLVYCNFTVFLSILCIYYLEIDMNNGYASLFHFPRGYIEDITKKPEEPPEEKLPSSVLQITVHKTNGIITTVSDSCEEILMCSPIDLIGLKYDDIFTKDEKGNRVYSLKRKPKTFIESKIVLGKIIRVALFDNNGSNNLTTMTNTLSTKLPQKIAKVFLENSLSKLQIKQCSMMIIKFNTIEYNQSVEQIFLNLNNLIQIYSSVLLLRIEGSLIYLLIKTSNKSVPFLFIRDLLNNEKNVAYGKKEKTVNLIDSIVLMKTTVSADIFIKGEPYI